MHPHTLRRPVGILAAGALAAAVLTGCGGGTDSSTSASGGDGPAWCGTKELVVGFQDGGGLNGWSKESKKQALQGFKECPNITDVKTVDAKFDLQQAISGLQSMVSQGAKAVVIIPDAGGSGEAELPGIRSATQRGVQVVPWAADPGGKAGTDYLSYVDSDHRHDGKLWGEWMAKQLPDGGKVIFVGGPAGNQVSADELEGIKEGLGSSSIDLASGDDTWIEGNWDPAAAQQAVAAFLSQNPDVDGVISDEGLMTTGIIKAFQTADVTVPSIASLEANALACDWEKISASNPEAQLATSSARNWTARIAVQAAVAKAQGVKIPEDELLSPEDVVQLPLFEDSTAGDDMAPRCDSGAAEDALLSNDVTDEQIMKITRGEGGWDE
ncbi:MAG: substrate-binding domain-containing protein [Nocardioidaceae bacterium]|nr:substrate-binding domain-containing protein [Nocardioidaceae bacterium]